MSQSLSASRWPADSARKWYDAQPYPVGANFIPSTAINQLEMWQADSFDPTTIDRELSWAAGLGMTAMRVFLHNLLWEQDADGFCQRIDQYLSIAERHRIRTLFVIFDDCWNNDFALGRQPAPKPFTHNSGWVQSPGKRVVTNSSAWSNLERYVKQLLTRFRADARILGWDLYNEPGNGYPADIANPAAKACLQSLPLLTAAFGWARSVQNVTQPLTSGLWNWAPEFADLNEFSAANSDIVTFHNYKPPQDLANQIREIARYGRPMICTEYMARGMGSSFEYNLPILVKHRVGAINWGLVSGKSQTIYPWGWNAEKGEPDVLFHDVFNPDGSMLYPSERQAIRSALDRS